VLEQLQADQEQLVEREARPLRAELEACRAEAHEAASRAARVPGLEAQVAELQTALARRSAELAQRAAEADELRGQVRPLEETLHSMAAQLEGMSQLEDASVDKRVVRKLLVTFWARPGQRRELLELMDRILQFSEEEKEVLGLSRAQVPPSPSGKLKAAAQKPITELWVDFLLRESGAELAKPVPRKT
jgi:Tfp pilus assembly protein FimV